MKDPKTIYESLITSGDKMAEAVYQYRILDDATKSILAQITIEAKQVVGTMGEAKEVALCASVYRDHLLACAEASRIAERAKIRYYSQKTLSDLYRTQESTERAAMGRAT